MNNWAIYEDGKPLDDGEWLADEDDSEAPAMSPEEAEELAGNTYQQALRGLLDLMIGGKVVEE